MPGAIPTTDWASAPTSSGRPFRRPGYDLKALVDADIAACPEAYPHITTPDPNIDFRRVNTLDTSSAAMRRC